MKEKDFFFLGQQ